MANTMSPESIEARFAALAAEVRMWESQLRALAPLTGQYSVLDDRISRSMRDIEQLRVDMNTHLHELQGEMEQDLRREIERMADKIREVIAERNARFEKVEKSIGDCGLTAAALVNGLRDEVKSGETIALSKRGQNLSLIVGIIGGLAILVAALIAAFG